jgi:hypothetical protein
MAVLVEVSAPFVYIYLLWRAEFVHKDSHSPATDGNHSLKFLEVEFFKSIFVEVSGHKLASSQIRFFVYFSTLIVPFYKMVFMKSLKFSCFADFFGTIFKSKKKEEFCFFSIRQ